MDQPLVKNVFTKEEIDQQNLTAAYREVFGRDGKRNEAQQAVWQDLIEQSSARKSTHFPGRDGKIDPYNAAIVSGRRDIYLHIEQMLHFDLVPVTQDSKPTKRI